MGRKEEVPHDAPAVLAYRRVRQPHSLVVLQRVLAAKVARVRHVLPVVACPRFARNQAVVLTLFVGIRPQPFSLRGSSPERATQVRRSLHDARVDCIVVLQMV